MKKHVILWSLAAVFLVFGMLVYAAESKPESEELKVKTLDPPQLPAERQHGRTTVPTQQQRTPDRIVRPTSSINPEDQYRNRNRSQEIVHQELINELTEVKKIAEQEGAQKTLEALQKLIDKQNQEYQQLVQEREKRRLEMQKRIEERMKTRRQGAAGMTPREVRQQRTAQQDKGKPQEESQ